MAVIPPWNHAGRKLNFNALDYVYTFTTRCQRNHQEQDASHLGPLAAARFALEIGPCLETDLSSQPARSKRFAFRKIADERITSILKLVV